MKPLLCLLVLAVLPAAADWPHLSGPTLDFHAAATAIGRDWKTFPPALVWKTALSDNGHACASCAKETIFIVDHLGTNDIVRALALADGKESWRYAYPDTHTYYHGFARATPTVYRDRVYTVSRMGLAHCLDATTGRLIWKIDFIKDLGGQAPNHGFTAPVGVWGDKAFLQPGGTNGNIVAVHQETGKLLWRGGNSEKPGYSLPVIVPFENTPTLLCYSANALMGLDPDTGSLLWTHPRTNSFGNNIVQPVIMGNRLFTGASDHFGSTVIEIRGGRPHEVWETKAICPLFTTPVLVNGHFFGTSSGKPAKPEGLMCFDPDTGKINWKIHAFEHGQVLAADGVVLALDGQKGDLVMIEPTAEAYREITRFTPLGGRSWATFFTVGDRLIIRNQRELACFRLVNTP
ncbi:MAG: PQQ-like beta-propeller repeat protein [Kiritimatiellae bacterium]|nr:PQQ-like beta-propeller repeat protein [Kiritimatiellia bacterium]